MVVPAFLASSAPDARSSRRLFGNEARLGDGLVTLQAVAVLDREDQLGGLNGSTGVPRGGVARAKQLRLHTPG